MKNQLRVVRERTAGLYSGRHVQNATLFILTGIAVYLCWLLARPFLAGVTWGLALAVVAYPLHARFERWFRPSLAALLSVIAVVIVLLAPGALLIQNALDEAGGGLGTLRENFNSIRLHAMAERYPVFAKVVPWLAARFDFNQELKRAAGVLANQASTIFSSSIRLLTQIVIMLVTLFYFLRDHKSLLQYLRRHVPLSQPEADRVLRRVADTIYVTFYGNVVVKLVQGFLGGAMFWVLGLPAPVLCGLFMAVFAMLPMVGTSLVWGPAVILLLVQGSWIKAVVLTVWGSLVVSLIDNFLYPVLVANELRIHTLGILLSILGGLIAFGLAGIVLGPVILASTGVLLEIWRHRVEGESQRSSQCPV